MGLGILLAFISVVMTSLTNTIQEYIADRFPASGSLLVQYFFLAVFAALAVGVVDGFALPDATPWFVGALFLTGVVGYVGIRLLYKALSLLNVGIVMMIAFSYVFFSYGINLIFFPEIEQLSWMRIVLGILFFIVISQLLLQRNEDGTGFVIDTALLLPIGTALCWAVFFAAINYYIKSGFITPFQNIFYTEGTIFVVALIEFLATKQAIRPLLRLPKNAYKAYMLWGVGAFLMGLFTYYAYIYAPANLVNVIKLGSIMLTAFFGWVFLRQRLTQKEITLLLLSVVILAGFVLV